MKDFSSCFTFSIRLLHHCPTDTDKDHSVRGCFSSCLLVELKVFMFFFSSTKLLQGIVQAGNQGKCLDAQSKYACVFVCGFYSARD